MNISNNNNISFSSRFLSSRATAEVNEYAKDLGYNNFIKELNSELKHRRNYKFNVKHHYSKPQGLCKTEIKYEKDGIPYKYIVIDSKISNPIELTFNILNSLKDKSSKAFQNIFYDYK